MKNGRSRRRRRNASPTNGATRATASRLTKPENSTAPKASAPSPENGSRAAKSASTTVSTANAGHIQAPRRRQRRRRQRTDSTIVLKPNRGCRRLITDRTAAEIPPVRTGGPPGDPGRRTETVKGENARWRPRRLAPQKYLGT